METQTDADARDATSRLELTSGWGFPDISLLMAGPPRLSTSVQCFYKGTERSRTPST